MNLSQAVEVYKNIPELQNQENFSIDLIEKSKLALTYILLERKKGKNLKFLDAYQTIQKKQLDSTQMASIQTELKSQTVQINRQAVAELPSIVR